MDKKSRYKELFRKELTDKQALQIFKYSASDIVMGDTHDFDQAVVETVADGSIDPEQYDAMHIMARKLYRTAMDRAETIEDVEKAHQESLLIRMGKAKLGITDIDHKVKTTHNTEFNLL